MLGVGVNPFHDHIPCVRRSPRLHGTNAVFEVVLARPRARWLDEGLVEVGLGKSCLMAPEIPGRVLVVSLMQVEGY